MYGVSHEGKYCTKFLNQYSFICSKFYKLYKYNSCIYKKTMVKSVIYLLFSYQTGYIMWHSRLMIYIPFGCASRNIDPKPGMSHYIPCLIAEYSWMLYLKKTMVKSAHLEIRKMKIKEANLFNTVGCCFKKNQWLNP
jgi:hypothetical protein